MLNGQYFFKGDGSTQHSPTFPRGGLAATFLAQILQLVGSPSLIIGVEHKSHEDTSFISAGTFGAVTTVSNPTVAITGLKEEIRFAYTITATNAWEGLLLNMLSPAWRLY
jgi:hypothetical protein